MEWVSNTQNGFKVHFWENSKNFIYWIIFYTWNNHGRVFINWILIFIQIATGEKRKSTSESFSLEKREGSTKRHSKRSRHQNEARYSTARHPDEAPQFTNGSMSLENCTCSLYAPHSSHKSQDHSRAIKRDACTSPTIPSSSNLTCTTKKGMFEGIFSI